MNQFEKLFLGKTIHKIWADKNKQFVIFYLNDGTFVRMYHHQDCCETVYLTDVCGEYQDILGSPITKAEEKILTAENENIPDRKKFSFYDITTFNGSAVFRWFGESNGYYSESVDFDCRFEPYKECLSDKDVEIYISKNIPERKNLTTKWNYKLKDGAFVIFDPTNSAVCSIKLSDNTFENQDFLASYICDLHNERVLNALNVKQQEPLKYKWDGVDWAEGYQPVRNSKPGKPPNKP